MTSIELAELAVLAGALGAVFVLVPRGVALPLAGFALLALGTAGLASSLIEHATLALLFTEPTGLALLATGAACAVVAAIPLARYPEVVPVVLLVLAPFRIPVQLGNEEAFLLLPLYLGIASSVLALGWRMVHGARTTLPPFLALPIAALVVFTSVSYLWTWDRQRGAIALAFFVLPFVAGFATVARSPIASWLPRALLVTLVALGSLFAAIGVWQAQTRTLFFARDVEVANAYTTFFRVTSLFKDPSLYGRHIVVTIAVLLVAVLVRRGRAIDWVAATAVIAFLFWGLFYSYSQSSFVALFAVTAALGFFAGDRRTRIVLVSCAVVATLAAAVFAAQASRGRSFGDVTSGRSRLVTVTTDAFTMRPIAGVGVGGQPRASADAAGRRSSRRSASHTTPLTILAELGVIGFVVYLWFLAASTWALVLVARRDRTLGVGLGAVLLVLFVQSLLYAGFFEDPLTWGVLGIAAATLTSAVAARVDEPSPDVTAPSRSPRLLAH